MVPVQNDSRPFAINYILEYLQQDKEHCCLFEEPLGRPLDIWVKRSKIEYVHLGDEMYYFFGNNTKKTTFEDAFKTSEAYYFLCVLSSLTAEKQNGFSPFSSLSSEELRVFAANAVSFFVRAYDGEGYLEWNKEAQTT